MARRLAGAWCVFADPVGRSSASRIADVGAYRYEYVYIYIANISRVRTKKQTHNKKGKKRNEFRKKKLRRTNTVANKEEETTWRGLGVVSPKLREGNFDILDDEGGRRGSAI